MAASQPTAPGLVEQPSPRAHRDMRRVLVVEPHASTRGLMQFGLVRAGFQVTSVRSAEDAELALEEGPQPALVVSESRLPGLDGFAFCARLRRSSSAELPVLLTGQPSERAVAQAASVGADDYLAKPLFAGDLATLARLESSRAPASPTMVASTREVPVAAALRALLAGTRSGRLVLGTTAELLFRAGTVVAAQVRSVQGERALRRMLLLGEGAYAVHLGAVRARPELGVDLRALCGPWAEALAAWRSLVRVSVPLDAVLCPDLRALLSQIAQLPEEVEPVVRLFDGERTVRAVVLESSLPEAVVLQVSSRLYASGALLPARVARARGLEPLPVRIRTGFDDPVGPRSLTPPPPGGGSGPFVPWSTGSTPAPIPTPPAGTPPELVAQSASPEAAEPPRTLTPPLAVPGLAWDHPSDTSEMERALRSVPLGLEPAEPPRPRTTTPAREVPQVRPAPGIPAEVPIHRPPTPPAVAVALEAGEESPLAAAARAVATASARAEARERALRAWPLVGLVVLALGFAVSIVWVRMFRPVPPTAAPRSTLSPLSTAQARFDAGDDAGAEEAAMTAAALDGADPRPHLLLSRIHLRRGAPDRARSELVQVLALEQEGPWADEARKLLLTLP
jgi:CheY-like chemotaxis protein